MRRREFISWLASTAAGWPATRAQQGTVPLIGAQVAENLEPDTFFGEYSRMRLEILDTSKCEWLALSSDRRRG